MFLALIGSLLALTAEAIAYALRWSAEAAQDSYVKSMTIVEVLGGGRFQGFAFTRTGRKYDPFLVTTYAVQVSDASESWAWLFVLGMIFAGITLIVSLWTGLTEARSQLTKYHLAPEHPSLSSKHEPADDLALEPLQEPSV